jgi:hypothetical protein
MEIKVSTDCIAFLLMKIMLFLMKIMLFLVDELSTYMWGVSTLFFRVMSPHAGHLIQLVVNFVLYY